MLGTILLLGVSIIALTRTHRELPVEDAERPETSAQGIRFFDIGGQTVIDAALRKVLVEKLGPDGIMHRAPVDLTIDDRRWTEMNLPRIWSLHAALNPPLGERREHDIIILTYRRTQSQKLPLRYVEIAFIAETGRPLYVTLKPTDDAAELLADLRLKYGPPAQIGGAAGETQAWVWKRDDDILTAARIPRRGERVETILRLYFTGNIESLLTQEQKAAEAEQRREIEARRNVF